MKGLQNTWYAEVAALAMEIREGRYGAGDAFDTEAFLDDVRERLLDEEDER